MAGTKRSFTFSGTAGDRVRLRMLDTGGNLFVPNWWLYRPGGSEFCDAAGASLADSVCPLPTTGTYTIQAGDSSGQQAGAFALFLERVNNPGAPTPITFGQTLSGTVTTPPELKAFTFSATAGDRVRLRMLDTGGGLFGPNWWLNRPDGSEVCSNSGASLADSVCLLPTTGTYTILAGDSSGQQAGAFTVFLERLNNPGAPTPITFGQTLSGTVTTPPELKAFTFSATAGDWVRLRMLDTGNSLFGPNWWLHRSDGSEVCSTGGASLADSTCLLPTTGTYTILAGDTSGQQAGAFTVFLERLNNPGAPTPISLGQTKAGAITIPAELKPFTFTAASGCRLLTRLVDATGTSFIPTYWVYRPNGSALCDGTGDTIAESMCDLDTDGTYTLLAGDSSGQHAGNFGLFIQCLNAPGLATPIAYQQIVTETVSIPGEWHTYVFQGTAGDRIAAQTRRLSGNLNASVRIYRPDAGILCQGTTTGASLGLPCSVDNTGTYTVLAGDAGVNTGTYEFNFTSFLVFMPFVRR